MEYQVLIQPAISVILAIISGLWSYVASKANNKAEIENKLKNIHILLKNSKENFIIRSILSYNNMPWSLKKSSKLMNYGCKNLRKFPNSMPKPTRL